ncbi:hypothetical protein [Parafrankia sp. BMG5.11]|uniref:hypothetical protein n=1 Tax=Parafrankia sp. BMG5.11 TaxID=222540 RepID=UPI00103D0EB7|nr:hypothetical protein [Parafrankia sp. BMG5.11]TCJ39560.1 hypothetical protein E0504_10690 [Parafrankia sp. BMG5.11]
MSNTATLLTGMAFAGLWVVPWLSKLKRPVGSDLSKFRAGVLAIYGTLFLAAAWNWRVPLQAQKSVTQLTNVSDPSTAGIGCPEITGQAEKFEKASDGTLEFVDDGSVLIRASLWQSLDTQQRELFTILAEKLADCAGAKPGQSIVKDILSGEVLNDQAS